MVKLNSTVLAHFRLSNLTTSQKTINAIEERNPLQKHFCHPDLWNLIDNYLHNLAWRDYQRLAR